MATNPAEVDFSSEIDNLPPSDLDDELETIPSDLDRGNDLIEEEEPAPKVEEEEDPPKAEEEEPAPKEEKPHMLPKYRYDEVNAKRRALEIENESLKQQLAQNKPPEPEPEPEFDFGAQQKAEYEAILDGDIEKAANIRAEIDAARIEVLRKEMATTSSQVVEETQEEAQFNQTVDQLQKTFPIFDPNHDDFNDQLTQEALVLRDSLTNQGIPKAAALVRAVRYTLSANRPDLLQPMKEDKQEPNTAPKTRQAARQQPADLEGSGNKERDTDSPDVTTMTEEEFDALPESVKRRLRGD